MQTTSIKISNRTIIFPKSFIDQWGLKDDIIAQATIKGSNVVIQLGKTTRAPYRVYSDAQINQFLKYDQLPRSLAKRVQARLSSRK